MKNKLKYIYLSIVATLIFVFTFTLVNTKTYAYTYNENTGEFSWDWTDTGTYTTSNSKINNLTLTFHLEDNTNKLWNGNLKLYATNIENNTTYLSIKYTDIPNITYEYDNNDLAHLYYNENDNKYKIKNIYWIITDYININYTNIGTSSNQYVKIITNYSNDIFTYMYIEKIFDSLDYFDNNNEYTNNNYTIKKDYSIIRDMHSPNKTKISYYTTADKTIILDEDNTTQYQYICDVNMQYTQLQDNKTIKNNNWFWENNTITQDKYNDYVDTHTHTNTEYETLENQYNDLQDQYDTLENNYNEVYNTLKQFEMWRSYGAFTYLDYVNYYGGDIDTNYTLEELIQEQILVGNTLDISKYFKNRDITDNNSGVNIVFQPNYYTINNSNVAFYDFHPTTTSFCSITINISGQNHIYQIPMTSITWNNETKDGYNLTSTYLKNYFSTNNIEIGETDYIVSISLGNVDIYDNIDYENVLVIYPIDIDSYNVGYNNGYNDGQNALQPKITQLQEQITELNEQISNLNQEIINKQSIIEGKNGQLEQMQTRLNSMQQSLTQLQQQYNTLKANYDDLVERYNRITGSDNDLYQMIIAVADTPITIFKQIFNFDVLGINISGFVTMIISLLVIIWLIKKII